MLGKGLREREDLYLASNKSSSSPTVNDVCGEIKVSSFWMVLQVEAFCADLICAMTCGYTRGKESLALPIFTCFDPGITTITVSFTLGAFEGLSPFVVVVLPLPLFTLANEVGYNQVDVSVLMLKMDCAHLAGGRV